VRRSFGCSHSITRASIEPLASRDSRSISDGSDLGQARGSGSATTMVGTIARGGSTGRLGKRVGVAPRLFLRRLVDVLDRVEEFPDFDPGEATTISRSRPAR
jgi:hypothetical protein